ncbi:hypothetical protein HYR99_16085 [Candidatus Poribacteria bacterium]|nr:hypothetical protein [Candidatus Poribacteria bacterium]
MKRKIFATESEAVRELVKEYTLRQISALQRKSGRFERKHGMSFERFEEYLHERSVLLSQGNLSPKQRQALSRALMQEEDDWLDWKAAKEMLENWLGLRQEVEV